MLVNNIDNYPERPDSFKTAYFVNCLPITIFCISEVPS